MAATLVLVACGLLASGIAVTSILQHSLINRVDQTLLDASRSWAQAPRRPSPPAEGPNPARPPSNFYVRGIDPDGRIWMAVNDRDAEPSLPDDNDVGPVPVTVGSINHSKVEWRAMTVRGLRGELTTVAIDLSDVQSTVRALTYAQIGIGAAVLLVLMWLAEAPWANTIDPDTGQGTFNNPFMDEHIIYAIAIIMLMLFTAERTWGLGKWWESTSLVQRFPWLA